jgi:hypothetical protein
MPRTINSYNELIFKDLRIKVQNFTGVRFVTFFDSKTDNQSFHFPRSKARGGVVPSKYQLFGWGLSALLPLSSAFS